MESTAYPAGLRRIQSRCVCVFSFEDVLLKLVKTLTLNQIVKIKLKYRTVYNMAL